MAGSARSGERQAGNKMENRRGCGCSSGGCYYKKFDRHFDRHVYPFSGAFLPFFRFSLQANKGKAKPREALKLLASRGFYFWPARRDSNPRPLESESTAISSFATGGYRRTTKSTRSLYTETAANARGNFRFFDFLQKHAPITANGMDFHGFGAKAVPIIPRDSCRRRRFSDGSEIF